MNMRAAGIVLLCVLAACERKANAPASDGRLGTAEPIPVAATGRDAGKTAGGFGDAWAMPAPASAALPDPAPAADPRKQMQDRIAKFRAARLLAQQATQPRDPVSSPQPGPRPGDQVEQRAGDRVAVAANADAAQFAPRGPAIGAMARTSPDPAMHSRIERFRTAQLARTAGAVPDRPVAVHGIPAGTRPGDSPGLRPGDLAPPRR